MYGECSASPILLRCHLSAQSTVQAKMPQFDNHPACQPKAAVIPEGLQCHLRQAMKFERFHCLVVHPPKALRCSVQHHYQ